MLGRRKQSPSRAACQCDETPDPLPLRHEARTALLRDVPVPLGRWAVSLAGGRLLSRGWGDGWSPPFHCLQLGHALCSPWETTSGDQEQACLGSVCLRVTGASQKRHHLSREHTRCTDSATNKTSASEERVHLWERGSFPGLPGGVWVLSREGRSCFPEILVMLLWKHVKK